MPVTASFVINSMLLGVGLAMDAFSVSVANGLNEPRMRRRKMLGIAGMFAFFQALMPMTGWFCVHRMLSVFEIMAPVVPWVSLVFLVLIGGFLVRDGLNGSPEGESAPALGLASLITQGIATSIDALSVGFTIAAYPAPMALLCSLLIAAVTFVICLAGVQLGRRVGDLLSGKAMVFGGLILIFVGVEIWASSVF